MFTRSVVSHTAFGHKVCSRSRHEKAYTSDMTQEAFTASRMRTLIKVQQHHTRIDGVGRCHVGPVGNLAVCRQNEERRPSSMGMKK